MKEGSPLRSSHIGEPREYRRPLLGSDKPKPLAAPSDTQEKQSGVLSWIGLGWIDKDKNVQKQPDDIERFTSGRFTCGPEGP